MLFMVAGIIFILPLFDLLHSPLCLQERELQEYRRIRVLQDIAFEESLRADQEKVPLYNYICDQF